MLTLLTFTMLAVIVFVLFVVFPPTRESMLKWTGHHYMWRTAHIYLCSTLINIELWLCLACHISYDICYSFIMSSLLCDIQACWRPFDNEAVTTSVLFYRHPGLKEPISRMQGDTLTEHQNYFLKPDEPNTKVMNVDV